MKIPSFCLIVLVQRCICMGGQMEKIERHIEKSFKDFDDYGIKGVEAELAHFTKRWGFVDFMQETDPDLITAFYNLIKGHRIKFVAYNDEIWNDMKSKIKDGMEEELCANAANDPVLIENDIKFDENAGRKSITLVKKHIAFFRYITNTPALKTATFAACPIVMKGRSGYFMYITLFEHALNEGEDDYYFIAFDLFHEKKDVGSTEVFVAMRTKLGAETHILEPLQKVYNAFLRLYKRFTDISSEDDGAIQSTPMKQR